MIGIIGAMDEEVQAILTKVTQIEKKVINSREFYLCEYENNQLVVCKSGIGKVNAALTTTLLLTSFNIDYIINVGTAGGISSELKQLDVVVSTMIVQHDFDVSSPGGRVVGEVPGLPTFIMADERLVQLTDEVCKELDLRVYNGLIGSGDQFVTKEQVGKIISHFEDMICVDMEAAAIAQVCYILNVPFVVTRCISDIVTHEMNGLSFDQYLVKASENSSKLCLGLIKLGL